MLVVMNYSLTFDCLFICLSNRVGVVTIKIFRKIPIRDPRNVTWFEFSFQKYMIYSGPGGSGKSGKASQCNEV